MLNQKTNLRFQNTPKAGVKRAAYMKAGVLSAEQWRKTMILSIFGKKHEIFVLENFPIFNIFFKKDVFAKMSKI